MDAIKKILSPGKDKDDKTLYGSGTGEGNTHVSHGALTGEGSHFAGAKTTTSSGISDPHGTGAHPTTTTGPHDSNLANKADPRVDSDNSRIPGASDSGFATGSRGVGEPRYPQQNPPTSTGNTTGSALGGNTHSSTTTSGPHSSDLANKADPRVDNTTQQHGYGHDNTTSGGLGGSTLGSSRQHDTSTNTSGPHHSDLANKADPRVDSDNSQLGGSGHVGSTGGYQSTSGGSYHTGPSGSAVSSGPHQTETANRLDPRVNTSTVGHEDGHTHHERHGGGAEQADKDHSSLGSGAAAGVGGLGAAGLASRQHDQHQTSSDRGIGNTTGLGSGTSGATTSDNNTSSMPGAFPSGGSGPAPNTAGPHKSDILNKLDPRVDANPHSTNTGSSNVGSSTTGSSTLGSLNVGSSTVGGSHHTSSNVGSSHHDPSKSSSDNQYGTATILGSTSDRSQGQTTRQPENEFGTATILGSSTDKKYERTVGDSSHGQDSHHGRDAAVLGGSAGAAAVYGQSRSNDDHNRGVSGTHDATHHGSQHPHGATTSTTTHSSTTTAGPHSSDLANKADPRVDSDRSKEQHHGRDAGLVGAGGAAGYGASKIHSDHSNTTAGPHSSNIANKADPRVDSDRSKDHQHATGSGLTGVGGTTTRGHSDHRTNTTAGPHSSDAANKADPRVDSDRSKEHHHGRDAALVGGTGAGAYGASQLHSDKSQQTAGPHGSDVANKADPRVDSDRSKEHSHGRDAGLVGAGGAAGYGASKLHSDKDTAGPHKSDTANKADPRVDSDRSKEHHHGRDTAVAGGAGGTAAYGAHELHDKKAEKDLEKERRHEQKEHDKDAKHAEHHHDKHEKKEHKGFLSFLHRDKSKKYSKEEEEDFDRQEREHNSKRDRDGALATGAGVGAGGAYAAHKHHDDHSTSTATPHHGDHTSTATSHHGDHASSTSQHGPHATTGDHRASIPEAEKPLGSTIGDKLHGVERNRGVQGESGFPDSRGEHNASEFRKHQVETAASTQPGATSHGTSGLTGAHGTDTSRDQHATGGLPHRTHDTSGNVDKHGVLGSQHDTTTHHTGTGIGTGTGTGTSTGTGVRGDDYNSGPNKLHKDPPAGLTGQGAGTGNLDDSTGVKHSHAGDTTRNY